jgi:hypothetical protein
MKQEMGGEFPCEWNMCHVIFTSMIAREEPWSLGDRCVENHGFC